MSSQKPWSNLQVGKSGHGAGFWMYLYNRPDPGFFTLQLMKRIPLPFILLILIAGLGCKDKKMTFFPTNHPLLIWQGRTYADNSGSMYLTGSASSLSFRFYGSKCRVWLQNNAPGQEYNYISLTIDGVHQERIPIRFNTFTAIDVVPSQRKDFHDVSLYKETEPVNGSIIISAVEADSLGAFPTSTKKKIEFIGNSITVGMSSDESLVKCDAGNWYDQHNAYNAYGPRVARALDMDYMINGFSGIGMYRSTRDEYPVIKDVYESAFFGPDPTSPRWDFKKFIPDYVSICLGTNDFSDGGGMTPRAPFDPEKFITAYVDFLKIVRGHYPGAHIIITNTPMLPPELNEILTPCLEEIKSKAGAEGIKPISIFSFSKMYSGGCGGHPSVEEQGMMAEEFVLFLKGIVK
ncbi:MAG: hypothetical protein KA166_03270 [Saprospiraceae bacterium]|nr:hypothetical protein [Saprospiraceae bacterium]MBP8086319.1 hypothetical protein [Saprospiraceae bacterium]